MFREFVPLVVTVCEPLEPVSGFNVTLLIEGGQAASVLVGPANTGLGQLLLIDWGLVEITEVEKGKSKISDRKNPLRSPLLAALNWPFEWTAQCLRLFWYGSENIVPQVYFPAR